MQHQQSSIKFTLCVHFSAMGFALKAENVIYSNRWEKRMLEKKKLHRQFAHIVECVLYSVHTTLCAGCSSLIYLCCKLMSGGEKKIPGLASNC